MNSKLLGFVAAGLFMAATPAVHAQGLGHTWIMRGQVVQMANGEAVLCIGKADGAKPGQTLIVARAESIPNPQTKAGTGFRKREVGAVTIVNIIDDHFARANVTKGDVKLHDIVELQQP